MSLHVPDLPVGCELVKAAHIYADAGFFVLPVDPVGKHAGSLVGWGWPQKSSRDPEQITQWWTHRPDAALALHVGRSGGVAFDLDKPDLMPDLLRQAVAEHAPPFQSTREDDPTRGHYLFAAEPGRFGNSGGDFGNEWGDVRGLNGIVIVEPTPHSKAAEGGRYLWMRTGPLPAIPSQLAAGLRPPGASTGTVNDGQVWTFLSDLPDGPPCPAAERHLTDFPDLGRHNEMRDRQLALVRLGEQGHHGVRIALDELQESFLAVAVEGYRPNDWTRALRGAVAEVRATPTAAADQGCCGSIRDADKWAELGVDVSAYQSSLVVDAQPPVPVEPPPRSRLHGHVLPVSSLQGDPRSRTRRGGVRGGGAG